MSNLRQLKLRITDHFLNEVNLMKDIMQSGLTKNEIDELQVFLTNSPYSKLIDQLIIPLVF
jgi:hypothetical protein